jgi:hypothetical protein
MGGFMSQRRNQRRAREDAGKAPKEKSRSPSPKPELPAEAKDAMNAVLNQLAAAMIDQPRGATPDTEGRMRAAMRQTPTRGMSPPPPFDLGSMRGLSCDTRFTGLPVSPFPDSASDDQTSVPAETQPDDDEITHVSPTPPSASRSATPVFGGADPEDNAIVLRPDGLAFAHINRVARVINVDDATTVGSSIELVPRVW